MRLRVGSTYLNRNGDEVRIVSVDGDRYHPFNGDNDSSYTRDGKFVFSRYSCRDLVEEVCVCTCLGNLVFRIGDNPELCEAIQLRLFELGEAWADGSHRIQFTNAKYLYLGQYGITWSNCWNYAKHFDSSTLLDLYPEDDC